MRDDFEMGPAPEGGHGCGEALFGACFALDGDPPGDQKKEPPPPYSKEELERRERMTREYIEQKIREQSQPKPFPPPAQPKPEAPKPATQNPETPKPDAPNPFLKPAAPAPAKHQFPPMEAMPPKKEPAPVQPLIAKPPAAAAEPSPFKKTEPAPAEKEDFWKSIKRHVDDDTVKAIAGVLATLGVIGGLKLFRHLGSDAVRSQLENAATKLVPGSGEPSIKAFDKTTNTELTTKSADGKFYEITRPDGTKESISVKDMQRVRYEFTGADARQIKQLKAVTELQLKDMDGRAGWIAQTDVVRDANMQQKQRLVLTEGGNEIGTAVGVNADHTVQVKQSDGSVVSKVVGADTKFVLKVRDDVAAATKANGADISALLALASPKISAKQWKQSQAPAVAAAPPPAADAIPAQAKIDAIEKQNAEMQRQLDEVLKELGEMKAEKTKVAPGNQTTARDEIVKPGAIDEPVQTEKTVRSKEGSESVEFTEAERELLAKDYESRAKAATEQGSSEKASLYRELAAGLRSTDAVKRSGTERFIAEMCGGKGKALAIGGGALVLLSLGLGGLSVLREHQTARKQYAEAKVSGGK